MHVSSLCVGVFSSLLLPSSVIAAPSKCPLPGDKNSERAAAVKAAFQFAWDGYYKYAFPHDELHPVTNGYSDSRYFGYPISLSIISDFDNSRNGWGASAVDALSTALVMEIPEIVNTIVDYVPTVDFTKTDDEVSLFETTVSCFSTYVRIIGAL